MQIFPDVRTFIRIGNFDIAWYAVLIITGAIIALQLTKTAGAKRGIANDDIEDMFYLILLFGVIGARLWYVLFYPDKSYFLNDLSKIFAFREGGLAIQGGIVFGIAYGYYGCKKRGINFIDLLDSALPNLLIAQAVGRWGNFLNQEAFGQVVSEAYYQYWPGFIKDLMFIDGAYRQPTFLYESVLNIVGFLLIYFLLHKVKKIKRGDYAFSYFIWYGIVRFIVEHFRSDSLVFLNFKSAQLVSIIFIIIGVVGMLKNKNKDDILVLFDFDGTLADSESIIIKSFNEVFNNYFPEIEITREMEVSYVGPTLDETFKRYLDVSDVTKYVNKYREINLKLIETDLKEIENATKLLKSLKDNNVVMGVVSSRKKDSLTLGIETLNMQDYFDFVIGSDEVSIPKPNPEGILKAKATIGNNATYLYYVGDTVADIKAAKASNFKSIALLNLEEIKDDLRNEKPDYLIEDLLEVEEILAREKNGKV